MYKYHLDMIIISTVLLLSEPFQLSQSTTDLKPPEIYHKLQVGMSTDAYNDVAQKWLLRFNSTYQWLQHTHAEIDWAYNINITSENANKATRFSELKQHILHLWITQARQFPTAILNPDIVQQIQMITSGTFKKANIALKREIMKHQRQLEEIYNTIKIQIKNSSVSGEPDLANLMRSSKNHHVLMWTWTAWHNAIGSQMRKKYLHFTELLNSLARSEGYKDMGAVWKEEFDYDNNEMQKLWQNVKPLYDQLHAYIRRCLSSHYGSSLVHPMEAIPVHLLGSLWGHEWESLGKLCTPFPQISASDITTEMQIRNWTVMDMYILAESFYTSLGLEKMTKEFWSKSMLTKPTDDRQVSCHGAATNLFDGKDYRIRFCTQVTASDLNTVHHEMGHIQYFMAYKSQPMVFQTGAHPAIQEAVGDTIHYSFLTPRHLKDIGFMPNYPHTKEEDINFLMKMALMKLPIIPYSIVMDKWREQIFRNKINATNINENWWNLRFTYQGVKPPFPRTEQYFDPGEKFHISDTIPYSRYFYSSFLQVQFHKVLCRQKHNHKMPVPLHRCNIYGSRKAGTYLKKFLSLGSRKPWREILKEFTGEDINAAELMEYYAPLHKWLVEENEKSGTKIGWDNPKN